MTPDEPQRVIRLPTTLTSHDAAVDLTCTLPDTLAHLPGRHRI
nr:hypothetical protein [Micromonospora sp. DSM 115978]